MSDDLLQELEDLREQLSIANQTIGQLKDQLNNTTTNTDRVNEVVENIPLGFYRVTKDIRLIYANRVLYHDINGFSSCEEHLDHVNNVQTGSWYVDPSRYQEFQTILERDGYVRGFESEIIVPNTGEHLWISESARSVYDEDGEFSYYEGIIQDISHRKRSENLLRSREQLYRSIFQHSHVGIFRISRETGRVLFCNAKFAAVLGYPSPEAVYIEDHPLQVIDDDGNAKNLMMTTLLSPVKDFIEVQLMGLNNQPLWVVFSAQEHPNNNYIDGTILDITDRKIAEDALRHSEQRYRAFVENRLDLISLATPDTRFIYLNDAYCEAVGKTREELLGTSFIELVPLEADQEQARKNIASLTPENPNTPELIIKHPYYGEMAWLSWIDRGIFDEAGNLVEIQSIGRNITELLHAQDALKESELRYQTVFDNAHVGVFWVDFNKASLLACNPIFAEICGYQHVDDAIANFNIADHYVSELERKAQLYAIRSVPQAHSFNSQLYRKDGEIMWGSISMWYNSVTGIIEGTLVDITAEREADQKRILLEGEQQRIKILEQFIQDVAHDIRTPISSVLTELYLIKRSLGTENDSLIRRVETAELQARRTDQLLSDFLEMSKLSVTDLNLDPKNIVVDQILQSVIDARYYSFVEKALEVKLHVDAKSDDLIIFADETLLARLFGNLIDNAINYTPEGGNITVTISRSENETSVVIKDTGIGIGGEDLPWIFQRFYRADKARRSVNTGGAGLGLAIAKQIAERHGGMITVESILGQGSQFEVRLPDGGLKVM